MELFILAWIIGSVFVGVMASAANLSMGKWIVCALIVSPLLAVIGLVAVVVSKNSQREGGQ